MKNPLCQEQDWDYSMGIICQVYASISPENIPQNLGLKLYLDLKLR